MALDEGDGAVLRDGERDVFEDGADKVAAHDGLALGAAAHDRAAEVGEAAVGNDDEVSVERLLVLGATAGLDAKHAMCERALDQVCNGSFEDVDARGGLGVGAELLDEAAMVEGAALGWGGIRNVHRLACVEDSVSVHRDGVDTVKTRAEAQGAQSRDAAGLKKLTNDAVGFCEGALEECYSEWRSAGGRCCGGECMSKCRACDACTDDNDVVRRVLDGSRGHLASN